MIASGAAEGAGEALQAPPVSRLDGDAPDETDFANYFCTYGFIYHQVRGLASCPVQHRVVTAGPSSPCKASCSNSGRCSTLPLAV